jgi:hypothetical protein
LLRRDDGRLDSLVGLPLTGGVVVRAFRALLIWLWVSIAGHTSVVAANRRMGPLVEIFGDMATMRAGGTRRISRAGGGGLSISGLARDRVWKSAAGSAGVKLVRELLPRGACRARTAFQGRATPVAVIPRATAV